MMKAVPLVMIHGLMGSLDFYAPRERMRDVALHLPDLIGYGQCKDVGASGITLANQASHIVRYLDEQVGQPCVLLGHSVGGAVAMLVAEAAPERVLGVINVEGNFTLADAFWCRRIAGLSEDEWSGEHARIVADPAGWLAGGGIDTTPRRIEWANRILAHQPPRTVRAMACAVVAETGDPGYLPRLRSLLARGMPLFLLAGERSASGWDLPGWARQAARGHVVQKDTGHMMMLEAPDEFCRLVEGMAVQFGRG